jgi:hypothetical protein
MQSHLVNFIYILQKKMTTEIIYTVLRCQVHLRTAQRIESGEKRRKPNFSWAEKIPQNQPFTQSEDLENTYDVVELEGASGARWKTKLVHSKACEEDVRVSGHSHIKDIAHHHLVEEAREHIDELQKAGIKVQGAPRSLREDPGLSDNMLESAFYIVHQPMTLNDGTKSIITRYWWVVVALDFGN